MLLCLPGVLEAGDSGKKKKEIQWKQVSLHPWALSSSGPHMVSKKPVASFILFASCEYLLEIQRDKLWWSSVQVSIGKVRLREGL